MDKEVKWIFIAMLGIGIAGMIASTFEDHEKTVRFQACIEALKDLQACREVK